MPRRKIHARLTISRDPVEVFEDEIPGLKAQGLVLGYEGETAGLPGTPPPGDGPDPSAADVARKQAAAKTGKAGQAGRTPGQ